MTGGRLWFYCSRADGLTRQAIERCNPGGLLGLGPDTLPLADAYPDKYFIYRDIELFPNGCIRLEWDIDRCYFEGNIRGLALQDRIAGHAVKAVMGVNEPHPSDEADAERVGIFEAGWASLVTGTRLRPAVDAVVVNYGQGWPERNIATATWRGFQNRFDGNLSRVKLGYHGYRRHVNPFAAQAAVNDYERRPWAHGGWPMGLPVIMTEAGFDSGAPNYTNGYRGNLTSAEYAGYLKSLPFLVPEGLGFCIYLLNTADWVKWHSFDIFGDEVVLAAIAEANKKGDISMPEAWDRAAVLAAYRARLDVVPAFDKYQAAHPELGGWIDAAEYDVGPYRLRGACGGLVWARIGDWGNVRHATYLAQLPLD